MKKLNELQSYLTRLRGLMLTLIILCSIGCGNVWGASGSKVAFGGTSGTAADKCWSFTSAKNSAQNAPAYSSSQLRLYYASNGSGCSATITAASGYKLTKIVIYTSSTSYRPTVKFYDSASPSGTSTTPSWGSGTTLTYTPASSQSNITFQNANTSNTQLRTTYIEVYYEVSGGTTYTVTYNKNNASASGTMTDSNSPYASGATVTVLANSFTAPSGKVFSHWDTKADDSGTDYAPGATFSISGNTTLYAQWATAYTVTYNLNGGTGTTPTESAKASGATFMLHDGTTGITPPTKKVFSKWRDQDGTDYEGGDTYTMPSKNVTLTAQWVTGGGDYVLVEDAEDIGPGKYLIVYNNTYALNTHYGNVNANTYGTYTDISDYYNSKKIASNATTDALAYTVAETTNGYSIKRGEYLGCSSATNTGLRWDETFIASTDEWTLGVDEVRSVAQTGRYIRWNNTSGSYRFATYTSGSCQSIQLFKQEEACDDPELAYAAGSVTKTYGASAFTNTLTNSHGVAVTYSSSDPTVATVNGSGQVTILKAGSTTITASSIAQTVSTVDYCADEASYTLTVNKASISPTLTYTPNSVAVGENTSAPTVGGNPGGGGVTYAITSATPSGCATINTSTGVVSGEAVGSVTVTATVAATTNYNGGTATANVTIHAASYFTNGATVFVQAESSSAWDASACVKAWFNASGAGGAAQTTYWLFDATDGDAGKKLYATIVPATGDLNQVTLQRFASNCSDFWNNNGTLTKASDGGSNTFRSTGSGTSNVAWNGSGMTLDLKGDPNSWGSSLGTFADQGNGVWTATYNNYAPANAAGESQEFKISTNYNGWIGNTGSNNNATLNGMHVGSTYNITATLDVKDHSLTMSKTFVKGTVHFNLQGHGSAISDLTNVAAGSKISAPGTPSATGYDFGGWYKEPACTNAWNFGSDVVNETMTLYAKWTAHEYTITKTLTNVTSSPAIPSTYTYTGAAAGLNYTISPSDGYRLPTEITVSGTTYTWNPATGALALTGTISSNVTITIVAVQTHTVDWYVGGSAPANKIGDDGQTTVVDHGGKISDFPATTPDGSACDKVFVGWTNTSSYVHGTSPLFNDVAGSPTINADASFYAVFAEGGSTEDEITVAETGATAESGTYYSWSDVSISSDAVYAGNTAGGSSSNASVQMRSNNSNSGIVTKASGGKVTKVVVDWNSSSVNGRTLDIYGKNTAYTAATDLYDNSTQGTKLGSIVNGTSTELEISGDYSYIGLRSNSGAMYLNSITITWSSATGHTINCTSCANSVTVSYSAPGSGNMMTVTKGSTPIASGTSVKTCSAQSLTVTLTPATHYTVTGFTATGVTGVTTSNVGNVYTVNIPADKTGTLNLTPTFTPETPLTITLNTNGKGTFTNPDPWPIYSGESFTFPDVTPNDPSCATFVGWIAGTTFVGDGTTHDAPATIAASTVSDPQNSNATYTAVFYETETSESDAYVKVTSTPANWANDHYLIVYEDGGVAFDGSRTDGDGDKIDAASNTVAVSITSSAIAATNALAASEWKIALISGSNYSIQSASGKYIGNASNSNALSTSSSALVNTLSISSGDFEVVSDGGAYLRYNATSGQERFRYYKSSSYSSQQAIQLYKLGTAVVETRTYTTNPSCTPKYRVTVASVTGGSPSADPKYNPESTEVTITANPSAGYSLTEWRITKTTGGDNVTSTLLTGDKPTTASTTFLMPAYDVTVAASYAKKMVTELKVMDGSTVVANTTGSVSGTLNVSTGANKTLDVVITPSDAFDHSWTATVSAGSTYASITNVTAEGFRVNGVAQGDATITVTASNDEANGGTPKVVTFTVHVTDILPEEIILKREGSDTPIETLIMYYDASESKGQYVKVNVSYSPSNPTNKNFTFSSAATGKVGSHSHSNNNGYEVLVANGVTTDPVNCTFTSSADGSVTKVLAVTVLPILTDRFVDYVHGNATQTVSARLSADRYTMITDINTPSLSDASDADPTSEDCETAHYHLIGWLPQTTAEALMAAGTPITDATEGLVRAGVQVEATGQTWYAIWAEEQ